MPNGDRPIYDVQRRNRASTAATLRGVVALYLIYIGWKIASGSVSEDASISLWAGVLIGVLFIVAAIGFGVYTVWRYRADMKAAVLPEKQEESQEDSGAKKMESEFDLMDKEDDTGSESS